jgi:hypothetical protein
VVAGVRRFAARPPGYFRVELRLPHILRIGSDRKPDRFSVVQGEVKADRLSSDESSCVEKDL